MSDEYTHQENGIERIDTLKNCTSVTVNGNGNLVNNSLTITFPAADEPGRMIKNDYMFKRWTVYFLLRTYCTKWHIMHRFENIHIGRNFDI